MNISLSCWAFRFSLDIGPDEPGKPEYDPTSTTASQVERADPTHIGFAAPEWPEDKNRRGGHA